ncbi:hypothetical protein AHAS_Ahas11G0149800 [Arachis hypogaea]
MAKISLDNSAGGSLHMKKTPEEVNELIEMVVNNQYLYSSERNPHLSGMQVSAINTQDAFYDMNGGFNQGENYDYAQTTSEQGWRNHPNFGWKEQPHRPQPNFNNNSQRGFNKNKFNNFSNCQFQTSEPQQTST